MIDSHTTERQFVPRHRSRSRRGFTLVEIMVTLVVISILAGVTMVGIASARESARNAQTRALIARINEVLLNKWDEYRYRVLPVQLDPASAADLGTDTETPPQLLPEEAGRIRLMMLRDLMRMELPDRGVDLFVNNSGTLVASGATTVRAVVQTFSGSGAVATPVGSTTVNIPWTPSPQLARYQSIVTNILDSPQNGGDGDGTLGLAEFNNWVAENESAECLYLVMSTITTNGIPALDLIAPYQIDDTDGDGMREIVDGWDNPVSWIRWPAGSADPRIDTTTPDEFDILGSDWGADQTDVELAYSLVPQVISPGADGQLGLLTTQAPAGPYQLMGWPGAATTNGMGNHVYIDPYDRNNTGGIGGTPDLTQRPGAYVPAVGRVLAADNISNFDLL
jgi:prepilin-type N-terminal cleavage/methylation domain-containing protein